MARLPNKNNLPLSLVAQVGLQGVPWHESSRPAPVTQGTVSEQGRCVWCLQNALVCCTHGTRQGRGMENGFLESQTSA